MQQAMRQQQRVQQNQPAPVTKAEESKEPEKKESEPAKTQAKEPEDDVEDILNIPHRAEDDEAENETLEPPEGELGAMESTLKSMFGFQAKH